MILAVFLLACHHHIFLGIDVACAFRVKLLALYVVVHSPAFVISDPLPSFRSYTNYARLVMFSFGFQKAFRRGFQADDEVFFNRVRILYLGAFCRVALTLFSRA